MRIEQSVVLVTGANRGIGKAFVEAALTRGARKVYAAMRTPVAWDDPRVEVVPLDVIDAGSVARAVQACPDVTVLINNAGIARPAGFLDAGAEDAIRAHLETNLFGVLRTTQAFAPVLAAGGGGAVLNVLSVVSWFTPPVLAAYALSKAAAWSLTNGLREGLRGQGTLVSGLHVGFVDTDLTRGFDVQKVTPEHVAQAAFDGLAADAPEILADEVAVAVKQGLVASPPHYVRPAGR